MDITSDGIWNPVKNRYVTYNYPEVEDPDAKAELEEFFFRALVGVGPIFRMTRDVPPTDQESAFADLKEQYWSETEKRMDILCKLNSIFPASSEYTADNTASRFSVPIVFEAMGRYGLLEQYVVWCCKMKQETLT